MEVRQSRFGVSDERPTTTSQPVISRRAAIGGGLAGLSTVIKLAGRVAIPVPHRIAEMAGAVGWAGQLLEAPPAFHKYLRFLCVAEGERALNLLFQPDHPVRRGSADER